MPLAVSTGRCVHPLEFVPPPPSGGISESTSAESFKRRILQTIDE